MDDPAVAENGQGADGEGEPDDLDASALEGEVFEIVAAFAVDGEVGSFGYAAVVVVDEFAKD